jgi:hypothetical protein
LPFGQIECASVSSRYASFCSWVRPVRTDAAPRQPESRAGDRRPEQPETQEGDMGKGPATVRARYRKTRRYAAVTAATVMGAGLAVGATMTGANAASHTGAGAADSMAGSWSFGPGTATPIKHLVVIFQENISFDHYFGTYPHAANTGGQPFTALPGTPRVNGLQSRAPGGGTQSATTPRTSTICSPATRTTTTPTSSWPSTAGR